MTHDNTPETVPLVAAFQWKTCGNPYGIGEVSYVGGKADPKPYVA